MDGTQFGYCGFVPHTPTELAFARAEENDDMNKRVEAMLDEACRYTPVAKDQSEPMKGDHAAKQSLHRTTGIPTMACTVAWRSW
jgi:hypothetical protein